MAVFVFDCGGTLMEYAGMPAAWSALYPQGFRAVADALCTACTADDLAEAAARLTAFNPRITGREIEYPPAEMFAACLSHWPSPVDPQAAAEIFFRGLRLSPVLYPDSIPALHRLQMHGHKTAVLTNLPSGMPDALFRADIAPLLPYIDLYVSSGTCGFRKPNPAGLRQIAAHFSAAMEALVFIGDEDKDAATASRAGCSFLRIDRSGRGSAGCLHSLDALCTAESSG